MNTKPFKSVAMKAPVATEWETADDIGWQIYYSGTATGVATNNGDHVITETGAVRTPGEDVGKYLEFLEGDADGQELEVIANTEDSWTVDGAFSPAPSATDDFRIDDGGRGNDIVISSSVGTLFNPATITSLYMPLIEAMFTHEVIHDSPGLVRTWISIDGGMKLSSSADSSPTYYGGRTTTNTERARRCLIMPELMDSNHFAVGDDKPRVRVESRGTESTTEFTVKDIKGRMIYIPV